MDNATPETVCYACHKTGHTDQWGRLIGPCQGSAPFTQEEWADEIRRYGGNLELYVLSTGECGHGSSVKGIYLSLKSAMDAAPQRGSLNPFLDWAEQNGTWGNELGTWMQFDSEGWEYNKVERWMVIPT